MYFEGNSPAHLFLLFSFLFIFYYMMPILSCPSQGFSPLAVTINQCGLHANGLKYKI